jgi:hypothetical protein
VFNKAGEPGAELFGEALMIEAQNVTDSPYSEISEALQGSGSDTWDITDLLCRDPRDRSFWCDGQKPVGLRSTGGHLRDDARRPNTH